MNQVQKTTQKTKDSIGTTTSTGPSTSLQGRYPLLAAALSENGEETSTSSGKKEKKGAQSAMAKRMVQRALPANYSTKSSGVKAKSIIKTSTGTSKTNSTDTRSGPYPSSKPTEAYYGDVNKNRGEKINVHTLADYCHEHKLFSAEDFMAEATQKGHTMYALTDKGYEFIEEFKKIQEMTAAFGI